MSVWTAQNYLKLGQGHWARLALSDSLPETISAKRSWSLSLTELFLEELHSAKETQPPAFRMVA